jgi:mRNA-degrading endonuclease YafQ of YafQ-DinJ toxin-antitoxin module
MRLFKESTGQDPALKVHKLHGKQLGEWAYSVDYSYRITFVFLDASTIICLDIGTHDELYS